MKKISLCLMGSALLILSCQKNTKELPEATEEETVAGVGRKCASQEVLEEQLRTDPERARKLEELERKTEVFQGRSQSRFAGTLYVPVVVNVVLPDASKVSDAQIQTQIDVLNRDFGKTNSELSNPNVYLAGYNFNSVANCQIVFQLAAVVRKNSTTSTFGTNDAVKQGSLGSPSGGISPTNAGTHLNLWVCDLTSGLLGYAQFPGGSVNTDGVVIDYQAFGTSASYPMYTQFRLGRTATHEIGHWFNLRHIWGDARCGNDLVGDTPQHDADNSGCPAQGLKSRCAGKPLEQWMNYMDYTDDACMYMFTAGQKARMDAAIDGSRAAYASTTPK